ncbi:uncharacterized protein [Antedon mediterranea]|uniref:uncharacterized protein n=1 Tax=Antedon mediterranea TaxID=105859 RepID=UPI003AF880E2
MERIIRKELLDFLEHHSLICYEQFGFRQGRSCALQLLDVLENWFSYFDNQDCFDCIYLDYKKAFDSVPHHRLLLKMSALDDTKLYRVVNTVNDAQVLQEDLEKACDWSDKWQLPFNEGKCKVMHFGKKNNKHLYAMRGFLLNEVDHEKDLGVTIDSKLVFNVHVADVAMRANRKKAENSQPTYSRIQKAKSSFDTDF